MYCVLSSLLVPVLACHSYLGRYFCQQQNPKNFARAMTADATKNPLLIHFSAVAKELGVCLPISFFEKSGASYFNSLRFIDSDGTVLPGTYRKSHIPDGPGYQEKYYFTPGDSGFKVWESCLGFKVGVAICWDQWFPEAARVMVLQGADFLMYPSAIGSEPQDTTLDSSGHWRRVMQGHSAANAVPVITCNRVGREVFTLDEYDPPTRSEIDFYGTSFITDATGDIVAELQDQDGAFVCANIDIAANRQMRAEYGFFRDRRPSLYKALLHLGRSHL